MVTSRDPSLLSPDLYYAFAVCLIILLILGVAGQAVAFLVLLHKEHRSKELTCYLLNICVANLLALVTQLPLSLTACFSGAWSLGTALCYVSGITHGVTSFVMIVTLSYMCVTIYQHIIARDLVTNHDQLHHLTDNGGVVFGGWKVLLASWVLGIAFLIPTPLGWGSIAPQAGGTTCAPDWGARSTHSTSYLIVLMLVGYLVPLGVSFLYLLKIYLFTTQHPAGLQTEGFSFQYIRARAHHLAAAKVVSVEVLVFFFVWLPYWVCGVITLFGEGSKGASNGAGDQGGKGAALIPWLLAHVGPVYFPYVYAAMNERFRRTLLQFVRSSTRKRQVAPIINVDKADRSEVSDSTRPCSPNIMVPRSPLTNRAFQLPEFEEISNELATPRPKPQKKFHFTLEAITKFMRTSLDRLEVHHGTLDGRFHRRERRNTTEI